MKTMSDHEAWTKAQEPNDRYLTAFNEANGPLARKMAWMIASGQAFYNMPVTVPVAAPVATESASGLAGWQLALGI